MVLATAALIGFASAGGGATASAFEPLKLDADDYVPKVKSFVVILDASLSMGDMYQGRQKLDVAKDIISHMNQTLPSLPFSAGLRTFGQGKCLPSESSSLIYGMASYSTEGLDKALAGVICAGGNTPLEAGEKGALKDLETEEGKAALIIVSDGIVVDGLPVSAARQVKSHFGERICIYTVQVGANPKGKALLKQIADIGECGFSTNAESIASPENMADFVQKVFLVSRLDSDSDGVPDDMDRCPDTPAGVKVDARGCMLDSDEDGVPDYLDKCPGTAKGVEVDRAGCPLPPPPKGEPRDSDRDGVADHRDACPETPKGTTVDERGCWAFSSSLLFALDSSDLKPQAYPALNEAFKVMQMNPLLKVQINGHTCSLGSEAYNQRLSEKRARAVMHYLVEKGIDPDRLGAVGQGETQPAASNDTKEGRALNRRVEFTRMP
jgi:OOP family OmpA-OmpF porin